MEMKVIMYRPASAANAMPVTLCLSEADQVLMRLLEKQGFAIPIVEVAEAMSPEAAIEELQEAVATKPKRATRKKAE